MHIQKVPILSVDNNNYNILYVNELTASLHHTIHTITIRLHTQMIMYIIYIRMGPHLAVTVEHEIYLSNFFLQMNSSVIHPRPNSFLFIGFFYTHKTLSHIYKEKTMPFKIFKLRGATNKIIYLIIHGDRQKSSLVHGTTENLWWKSNFKEICFLFLTFQKL